MSTKGSHDGPRRDGKRRAPREDKTIPVGGVKRQRYGGSFAQLGGPPRVVPAEAAATRGFRFPAKPATRAQEEALARMIRDFLRKDFMASYSMLSSETLADALSISPRAAYDMAAELRKPGSDPEVEFILEVLHGMLTGKIAGVLGTRKNKTSKPIFEMIYEHDVNSTETQGYLILRNPDHCSRIDEAYRAAYEEERRLAREGTKNFDHHAGIAWQEYAREVKANDDLDHLRCLHAAFRLDYREWLKRK